MTLEQVAAFSGDAGVGSNNDHMGQTEFLLRQTRAILETAADAKRSADATVETADATKRSATYMLWSVLVLAASSVVTLIVTLWR